jgi:hypothetical protein
MGCLVFLMQEGGRALKSAIRKIDEKFSYLLGPQPSFPSFTWLD